MAYQAARIRPGKGAEPKSGRCQSS